jgi:hypothetical protein
MAESIASPTLTKGAVRVAVSGSINLGPVGTTLPTSTTGSLNAAFKPLGYSVRRRAGGVDRGRTRASPRVAELGYGPRGRDRGQADLLRCAHRDHRRDGGGLLRGHGHADRDTRHLHDHSGQVLGSDGGRHHDSGRRRGQGHHVHAAWRCSRRPMRSRMPVASRSATRSRSSATTTRWSTTPRSRRPDSHPGAVLARGRVGVSLLALKPSLAQPERHVHAQD